MFKYLSLAVFLVLTFSSFAQNGKIINKDFIIDTYDSVEFDLYGEIEFEPWEADYILVETTVKLWDTPKRVFENHLNRGRYFCALKANGTQARVASIPVDRPSLTARESVNSVVYFPSNFNISGSKIIRADGSVTSREEDKQP